jgi:hypothetical protein
MTVDAVSVVSRNWKVSEVQINGLESLELMFLPI